MTHRCSLRRDKSGTAIIEFALAVPVLLVFIYGIFQIGVAFQASSGMQHALGEGARFATIFPVPTDAQIKTRVSDRVFGTGIGTFTVADPVTVTNYKTLRVTFTMPTNFLLFAGPQITLIRTKRVYIAV